MRKPKNRKERIQFISQKLGSDNAIGMLYMTDKEVEKFVDSVYSNLKDNDDYVEKVSICIRCREEVLHHTECGCGNDRAVFNEYDWKDDIESFDEEFRLPQDTEFIENGYKLSDE